MREPSDLEQIDSIITQTLTAILETQETGADISRQLAELVGRVASSQEIALLTVAALAEILVEVCRDLARPDLLDKLAGTLTIAAAALAASREVQ